MAMGAVIDTRFARADACKDQGRTRISALP